MITARSQYDARPELASDLDFANDKGLTKQADARDADINNIFKRLEKGGALPDMIAREPRYGDFSAVPDYQEALNIVRHADEQFSNLPVELRNRFENNPEKFLAFVTDEANADEIEKMGLMKPEAVERRKQASKEAQAKVLAEQEKAAKAEEEAFIQKIVKAVKASQ